MSKKRIPALALILALLLGGCTQRSGEVEPAAERTSAPAALTPEPTPEPTESPITPQEESQRIRVSYKEEMKNYLAEGTNDLLLTYLNRIPQVELPGLEAQAESINAEIARLAALFKSGSEDVEGDGLQWVISCAANDYATRVPDEYGNGFTPCAYERDCSTVRGDGTVLSFLFSDYVNSGGIHGNTAWSGVSFDPETGERLTLSDLTEDPDALRALCLQELRSQCDGMKESLFDDYADSVEELYSEGLWYLNDRGLVFISNTYHLAPYAAGTLTFTVRYKALKGVLLDRFLLPSRDDVQGGLDACRMQELDLSGTEPELSVTTDSSGEKIVLRCFNSVYNIRLFTVDYDEASGSFYQKQELMYLSALHDSEYCLVQSSIPDSIPNLQLSWRLPDGTIQRYLISQSGEDGHILLIEPNTLARLFPGEVGTGYLYWDLDGDGNQESLDLTQEKSWQLSVSDGNNSSAVATPFDGEQPRLFVADVDEDNACEIFLQDNDALRCWRYNGKLESVRFLINGEERTDVHAKVLSADGDGLRLSCAFSLWGNTLWVEGLFRDGKDGTIALAYGSVWELQDSQSILLSRDLPYSLSDGSTGKLSAGTVIYPLSLSENSLRFATDSGMTAEAKLNTDE